VLSPPGRSVCLVAFEGRGSGRERERGRGVGGGEKEGVFCRLGKVVDKGERRRRRRNRWTLSFNCFGRALNPG